MSAVGGLWCCSSLFTPDPSEDVLVATSCAFALLLLLSTRPKTGIAIHTRLPKSQDGCCNRSCCTSFLISISKTDAVGSFLVIRRGQMFMLLLFTVGRCCTMSLSSPSFEMLQQTLLQYSFSPAPGLGNPSCRLWRAFSLGHGPYVGLARILFDVLELIYL